VAVAVRDLHRQVEAAIAKTSTEIISPSVEVNSPAVVAATEYVATGTSTVESAAEIAAVLASPEVSFIPRESPEQPLSHSGLLRNVAGGLVGAAGGALFALWATRTIVRYFVGGQRVCFRTLCKRKDKKRIKARRKKSC